MRVVAAAVALVLSTTACVGPSRTDADYRAKVANTAEAARASVETVRLTVEQSARGRAPSRYVGLALSEAQTDVSSIRNGFGSIQPPSSRSEQLRSEVTSLLDETSTVLASLRIAARAG